MGSLNPEKKLSATTAETSSVLAADIPDVGVLLRVEESATKLLKRIFTFGEFDADNWTPLAYPQTTLLTMRTSAAAPTVTAMAGASTDPLVWARKILASIKLPPAFTAKAALTP